ncbi:MAG: PCRF domain-containing protein, partial [Dehalococcoidia bacterium]
MLDKLRGIEERYENLTEEMAQPEVIADYQRLQALAKERASLELIVTLTRALRNVEEQIEEAKQLINDSDAEMARLGKEELANLEPERERLEQELKLALLPKDPHDDRNVIV